jgi:hypothetical protein
MLKDFAIAKFDQDSGQSQHNMQVCCLLAEFQETHLEPAKTVMQSKQVSAASIYDWE